MSIPASHGSTPTAWHWAPLGLVTLLALEVAAFTLVWDVRQFWGDGRWWARFLGDLHFVPEILVTSALAVAVFGGGALVSALRQLPPHPGRRWALACHGLSIAALLLLVRLLFRSHGNSEPLFWSAAAATVAAAASWLAALVAPSQWGRLLVHTGNVWTGAALVVGLALAASRGTRLLWHNMADTTLALVQSILRIGYPNLAVDPEFLEIGTPQFSVRVAPECAGYDGLGLVTAFVAAFLWFRRRELRFPAALALWPIGLLAAWTANVLRLVALVAIGLAGWPTVAVTGFHSMAGWIAFNSVAVGLVALGLRWRWLRRDRAESSATHPAVPYLAPLAVTVCLGMLVRAVSSGDVAALYPVPIVGGLLVGLLLGKPLRLHWQRPGGPAVAVGLVAAIVWLGADALQVRDPVTAGIGSNNLVWLATRVLGSVVVIPVVEELAFRGYLFRRVQTAEFETAPLGRLHVPALLVSSAAFGAVHPSDWVAATVCGALYAFAYMWRGRLIDAIVAHGVTNLVIAVTVLGFGRGDLWR